MHLVRVKVLIVFIYTHGGQTCCVSSTVATVVRIHLTSSSLSSLLMLDTIELYVRIFYHYTCVFRRKFLIYCTCSLNPYADV